MCGIIGTLLYFYCRSGCQASVVASFLAFHPPESTYDVVETESESTVNANQITDMKFTKKNDKYAIIDVEDNEHKCYGFVFLEDIDQLHPIGCIITGNPSTHIITTATKTKIAVLYFQYPNATKTILLSHGNATDLGGMYNVLHVMSNQLKVNIVGYDYTGYGWSKSPTSQPTEKQTYKDIESVYAWLLSSKIVKDPSVDLIIYGQSVGSGPSTYIASSKPCAGLVLHSPIMSGLFRCISKYAYSYSIFHCFLCIYQESEY